MTPTAGEATFQEGPYTVRMALRQDNPAFPKYLVFYRGELVGRQFSRPSLADCEWLHKQKAIYATQSTWPVTSYGRTYPQKRRGRPRKVDAQRQLEEALAA